MSSLQERIEAALSRVRDPRSGRDVLTAEKVRDIATSTAGRVRLTLLLGAADDPTLARDVRQALERVEGVTEVRVDVRDASTVDVITQEPFAALLTNLARLVILPKDAREKLGPQAFAQHPIGTGAYRFISWQRDQQLLLEANGAYWRGVPSPKRLVFRAIKDASTRASRSKRASRCGSAANAGETILSATWRFSRLSAAR